MEPMDLKAMSREELEAVARLRQDENAERIRLKALLKESVDRQKGRHHEGHFYPCAECEHIRKLELGMYGRTE